MIRANRLKNDTLWKQCNFLPCSVVIVVEVEVVMVVDVLSGPGLMVVDVLSGPGLVVVVLSDVSVAVVVVLFGRFVRVETKMKVINNHIK